MTISLLLHLALALLCSLLILPASTLSQQNGTEGAEANTPISNATELMALLQSVSGRTNLSITLPAGRVVNVSDALPARRPTGTMTGGILRIASSNSSAPAILDLGWRALATVGVLLQPCMSLLLCDGSCLQRTKSPGQWVHASRQGTVSPPVPLPHIPPLPHCRPC